MCFNKFSQDGASTLAVVDGLTTTFSYDGLNNRLLMSVAGEVTTYTVDYAGNSGRVLFEAGSLSKHYLYGYACLGEVVDTGTANEEVRYYQRDGNSMVRQTTNADAEVTYAWTYTPEGLVLVGEEGVVTHLDCGADAIYDWSTGLIFKNGGYFDPTLGIWLALAPFVVWQSRGKRKKHRRRKNHKWLLILMCLSIVLVLSACDGTPTTTPTPEATEASTPTCTPTAIPPTITRNPTSIPTFPPTRVIPPSSTPSPIPSPVPSPTPIPPTPTPWSPLPVEENLQIPLWSKLPLDSSTPWLHTYGNTVLAYERVYIQGRNIYEFSGGLHGGFDLGGSSGDEVIAGTSGRVTTVDSVELFGESDSAVILALKVAPKNWV